MDDCKCCEALSVSDSLHIPSWDTKGGYMYCIADEVCSQNATVVHGEMLQLSTDSYYPFLEGWIVNNKHPSEAKWQESL